MPSARLPCRNWWADRLTPTWNGGNPSARHAAAWRQAGFSTHSPIGTIIAVSSAMAMNSSGDTGPNSALVQRSKASQPIMRRLARSTLGW